MKHSFIYSFISFVQAAIKTCKFKYNRTARHKSAFIADLKWFKADINEILV